MLKHHGRPLIFGEVLFDCFPDRQVLGGAPFNVAWHLQGFGLQPLFVSRVGRDEAGEQVRERMQAWGMDLGALQVDADRPTGAVQVTVDNGQPRFDILPDQAYDRIDYDALKPHLAGEFSLLYHGSLIARHSTARSALTTLKARRKLATFVDINLRAPWCDVDTIPDLVKAARWMKVNDEELAQILHEPALSAGDIARHATVLRERTGVELLIVTMGAEGACLVTGSQIFSDKPQLSLTNIVDTVGAGDAFSAVSILGLVYGWPAPVLLERALGFAADICQIRGATTEDSALYQRYRQEWEI